MGKDMSTTDAAFGFQPYQEVKHTSMYAIVTAYATQVCIGDLVEAGGTAITTAKYGTLQNIQVEETGAAGSMLGAVLALFDSNGVPMARHVATAAGDGTVAGYALVADSPDQEYLVQEDGDTSSIQVADIGLNADAISTGTPAAGNNYLSKMELDSDTVNTTATLGLKILGVHPDDSISAAGAAGNYCRFIVKLNTAYRGDGIAGV